MQCGPEHWYTHTHTHIHITTWRNHTEDFQLNTQSCDNNITSTRMLLFQSRVLFFLFWYQKMF